MMISSLTLTVFFKLLALCHKLNTVPIRFDKVTCRVHKIGRKNRYKFLLNIAINQAYGFIQFGIVFWKTAVDDEPLGSLLQEFMIPITIGVYGLLTSQLFIYETETIIMINQLISNNANIRRLFWISNKERDGIERIIITLLYNGCFIVICRFPILLTLKIFNNMYAFYIKKMGSEYINFPLQLVLCLWDCFFFLNFMMTAWLTTVIFFLIVNSNKLWCKRLMYSLIHIEFQPKALRDQIINTYRALQLVNRLFTYVVLQVFFPLVLASCTISLIICIFVLIKFFNKMGYVGIIMVGMVDVTLIFVVWVILFFSFQMTKSSKEFLRIFSQHNGTKLGKVTFMSLEPLFVRIGFAYTATESTALTLFKIVLESVVNLLIAVE